MKDFLDKLIAEAPEENEGAVQLQLQIGGANYAGAMKHSEHKGLYEIITIGTQGGQPVPCRIIFTARVVETVQLLMDSAEMTLTQRKSGIIVPGLQ